MRARTLPALLLALAAALPVLAANEAQVKSISPAMSPARVQQPAADAPADLAGEIKTARITRLRLEDTAPKGAAQIVVGEATACLPLGSLIDLAAEKARLEKAIDKAKAVEQQLMDEKAKQDKALEEAGG